MIVSYEEARRLLDELEPEYQERHRVHAKLRDFWHGRYWDEVDTQAHGIASIFRDLTSVKSDVGPDMKLVRNLIFDVCLKYQSFLSPLPMIRTFVDRPDSRRARAQAAMKERVLYGTWAQANMNQQMNRVAWFGPLMGDSFLGIWPSLEYNCVHAIVRSPEHAYPVPNFDGTKLDALIFHWKTTEARAKRAFPSFTGKREDDNDKTVEILEYSDGTQFRRWVDTQLTNDIQHGLGFNLFDQVPFVPVPGEAWNHGAVEQSVGMVEAGNALYSLMMQAMIENVFPRLILEDPLKFSETIDTGPGATIGVNAGGKAYYLAPPTGPLTEGANLLRENEQAIKQNTSMPDVSFGQDSHSIITGKAVNALQGAGTGSVVEMVQGNGIGGALEAWNEKALTIYQRMFADDQILLYGMQPSSMLDLNPRQFSINFKGKEIIGSPRNEVVFSPYIDMHGKLVMALQAQGAGLTSKQWGREQIGISDSIQMQEEIVEEVLDEAVVGAIVQSLTEPTPDNADTALASAVAYLDGTAAVSSPQAAAPTPAAATAAPVPGGGGMPIEPLPGGGAVGAPALTLPPGSALSQVGAPSGAAPQGPGGPAPAGTTISLADAQQQLAQVDLAGKAWFVGEIVAVGSAKGPVEIAVTDPADKQPIADAASFQVVFHTVKGAPQEQAVPIESGGLAQAA